MDTKDGKSTNSNWKSKKARGRNEDPDVMLSKSLSWVLRHSGPSLGLGMLSDGYIPVSEILKCNHPKFAANANRPRYTIEDIKRVVETNNKQRFRLEWKDAGDVMALTTDKRRKAKGGAAKGVGIEVDGTTRTSPLHSQGEDKRPPSKNKGPPRQVLCIRANQGHSHRHVGKRLDADKLLDPISRDQLADPEMVIVHGTTRAAWDSFISREGLKRMRRTHIHFASGVPADVMKKKGTGLGNDGGGGRNIEGGSGKGKEGVGGGGGSTVISGMRSTSQVHIYVDGGKCARDSVPFHRSDNGVILTMGVNGSGTLPVEYIEKAVDAASGELFWKGAVSLKEGEKMEEG